MIEVIEVVELSEVDCAAAGGLLAARHARERELFPLLVDEYEDPARAADLARDLLSFCDGVAAHDEHRDLVGFLTSFESAPDPTAPMARYVPVRSSLHLVHGHSVAARVDARSVYAAMYRTLAERALERGLIDHVVHVPIGHTETETAWAALGFGRVNVVGIRSLAPLDGRVVSDVQVRQATVDELDIVDRLVDEEAVFHARSPIFRPYRRHDTVVAVRAEIAEAHRTG